MKTPARLGFLLLGLPLPILTTFAADLRISPATAGEPISTNFTVTVEKQPVPVYTAKVASRDPALRFGSVDDIPNSGKNSELASFASFDFDGTVEVTVTCPSLVKTAKILPTSYGITPAISQNHVSFKMSAAQLLTLEVNGEWVKSLHIFANPVEKDVPRADTPNVLFYGPGVHQIDPLHITSGQTLYVSSGAVLRGKPGHGPIVFLDGNNITVRGRGIIDGSLCPIHTEHLLSITGTNITVDGVILRDSSTWTVPLRRSKNVKFNNIKLFGHRANSDGIDICNSSDVEVSHSFLRTLDDLVVVKTDKGQGPAQNIFVKDCVLWNEVAHALSIGAELREPVNNVRFYDCDVIHDKGREWTLRVFHCDSALISNVVFEKIRVEETQRLMSLWIGKFVWTRDPERGHIDGVVFKDIDAVGKNPKIEFQGFDAQHRVENVKLQHVTINGAPLEIDQVKQNEFVKGVEVVQ